MNNQLYIVLGSQAFADGLVEATAGSYNKFNYVQTTDGRCVAAPTSVVDFAGQFTDYLSGGGSLYIIVLNETDFPPTIPIE